MKKCVELALADWLGGSSLSTIAEKYSVKLEAVKGWHKRNGWANLRSSQAKKLCEEIQESAYKKQLAMANATLDDCDKVLRALSNIVGKTMLELLDMIKDSGGKGDRWPHWTHAHRIEQLIRMVDKLIGCVRNSQPAIDEERVRELHEELKKQKVELEKLRVAAEKAYEEKISDGQENTPHAASVS